MSNSLLARTRGGVRSLPLGSRLSLALVVCCALGTFAWLWWSAVKSSKINFLPNLAEAEWVIYPKATEGNIHPRLGLAASFKRSFVLDEVPQESTLRVAGFHEYAISLNGLILTNSQLRGGSWKEPDLFALSKLLRQGTNEILVTVSNTNGPPAFWLSLKTGNFSLKSDESWEVSYASASWKPARLAEKPLPMSAGNALYVPDRTGTNFAKCWPILLLFAVISSAIIFLIARTRSAKLEAPDFWRKEWVPIAVIAALWIGLFLNNFTVLPAQHGYDSGSHRDYIAYIETEWSLPLATEGWEMFQPPLYYLICALLLKLLGLSAQDSAGVATLRFFGFVIGIAHFIIVWRSLRLLFPGDRTKQRFGLVLGAVLPPALFLSHYISNEGLAAVLVSGSIYLCLRILKKDNPSWLNFTGLGLCLGAALLTKSTAVLALPPIFGALIWMSLQKRTENVQQSGIVKIGFASRFLTQIAFGGFVILLVCGWHYYRTWRHFGTPIVGVWDPRSGFLWWQDDGFRTASYYLRFGEVFFHPWFSALHSFADGIYSTLWGDGLVGGYDPGLGPPWNYDLMSLCYWLALVPTLGLFVGVFLAIRQFIRRPSPEWFLILGLGFLAFFALTYMSVAIPYYCVLKAFYGFSAFIPFCALGGLGLGNIAKSSNGSTRIETRPGNLSFQNSGAVLCKLLVSVWAMSSFASFWILHSATQTLVINAAALAKSNPTEAQRLLEQKLASDARNWRLRAELVNVLIANKKEEQALQEAVIVAQAEPGNFANLSTLVMLLADTHPDEAIEYAERAIKSAPGYALAYQQLGAIYLSQGNFSRAEQITREGLSLEPFNSTFHQTLGEALVRQGKIADGIAALKLSSQIRPENVWTHSILAEALELQRRTADAIAEYNETLRLNPKFPDALDGLAWLRATDPQQEFRNGSESVRLAERACQLTENKDPKFVSTLAAAYAEAGRFEEAVQAATKARDLARTSGQQESVQKCEELIRVFKTRQPYRQAQK